MRNQIIVKRYAQAYVDFAGERNGIARCVADMKSLRWFLREEKDLEFFLLAPEIPRAEKASVLQTMFKEYFTDETITFINYLIVRNRVSLLAGIADQVRVQFAHGDLVDVTLRTTFPLELKIIEQIKASLEKTMKFKANLYLELNPDLLGGAQIIMGNRIIDGSVRSRLLELRKKLLQSQVI